MIHMPTQRPFIVREAEGQRSRQNVVVTLAGAALESGQPLVASGAKFVPYTGTGTPTAIAVSSAPAATGDVRTVAIVRQAVVNRFELVGLDAGAEAALSVLGIHTTSVQVPTVGTQTPTLPTIPAGALMLDNAYLMLDGDYLTLN